MYNRIQSFNAWVYSAPVSNWVPESANSNPNTNTNTIYNPHNRSIDQYSPNTATTATTKTNYNINTRYNANFNINANNGQEFQMNTGDVGRMPNAFGFDRSLKEKPLPVEFLVWLAMH